MKRYARLTMNQKRNLFGYAFISPWLVGFIIFAAIPFIFSMQLSLSKVVEYSGFKMQNIGWENYKRMFLVDVNFVPMFVSTIKDTVINTPIINLAALFFAILLNKKIKCKGLFRGIFFLPVLLGTGYVMMELLGQTRNLTTNQVNMDVTRGIKAPVELLQYLGPAGMVLIKGFLDKLTLVLWKSGVQILLYLAGLQGISKSLYESAYCDGATEWEMFWDITLPMLTPVILLNLIYTIIDSFTDSANPIVNYILGYNMLEFGYAAALGWVYFLFIIILISFVFFMMQRFIYSSVGK